MQQARETRQMQDIPPQETKSSTFQASNQDVASAQQTHHTSEYNEAESWITSLCNQKEHVRPSSEPSRDSG